MSDQPTLTLDAEAAALIADALAETLPPAGALLDADQAGRLLNVPKTWLLAEARADRLPHVRLGRYVRFDRAELLAWAAGRSRGPRRNGASA